MGCAAGRLVQLPARRAAALDSTCAIMLSFKGQTRARFRHKAELAGMQLDRVSRVVVRRKETTLVALSSLIGFACIVAYLNKLFQTTCMRYMFLKKRMLLEILM